MGWIEMSFKLRPLTALALGLGVVGLAQVGRVAFDATNAMAAGEAPKKEAAAPADAGAPAAGAAAPKAGPPMCLPVDLAKEAGISAAEFRLLQTLQERRQTLDTRERDIVTRENLLATTDAKIQERMSALKAVEGNLQKLLGQVDDLESQRITSLVRVYEKMKPKDAAAVWEGLDTEVLLKIAQKMKEQPLSLILAKMSPERAREVTRRLAEIDAPTLPVMAGSPPPAPQNAAAPAAAPATPPAAKAPPAKAPGQQAALNNQAKGGPAPKGSAAANAALDAKGTGPAGAGPTAPRAPTPKAPNNPSTPQPAAKAATGQAPADPAQRPKA
jgi:flagellar motility protein MotE (MotC chaperone)